MKIDRLLIQLQNPKIFLYNLWHLLKNQISSKVIKKRLLWKFDNGIKFYQDQLIGFQILRYKAHNLHEPDVEKVFVDIVKKFNGEGIFIDIGAAGGYYSILTNKLNPKIEVHAFNPHPTFFKIMEENILLNHVSNIIQHQEAISSELGRCGIEGGWGGKIGVGDSVEMTTIDNFAQENNISKIFLVKIDIQGEEYNALLGAAQSLNNTSNTIVETHSLDMYNKCKNFLIKHGHEIVVSRNSVQSHMGGLLVSRLQV